MIFGKNGHPAAEAAPIPTKEATYVAGFLHKMILWHGCPQEIVSDQGREFCNQVMDQLEVSTGFKLKSYQCIIIIFNQMAWMSVSMRLLKTAFSVL